MKITINDTTEEIQAAIDLGVIVEFEAGVYENAHFRLTKPVHLIGNGAVLVGGTKITWREENGLLVCDAPRGEPMRDLVVKGSLRMRARYPAEGYPTHETAFTVDWRPGDVPGSWVRTPTDAERREVRMEKGLLDGLTLHSAEATVVHSWSDSMVEVEHWDGEVLTLAKPCGYPVGSFGRRTFCIWNLPEALTKEGTFYHDTKEGKLYYKPMVGESIETEAYFPLHDSIFFAEEPVHDIEIEGFTLTATSSTHAMPTTGALNIAGAINFTDAHGFYAHDLIIKAAGGHGIRNEGRLFQGDSSRAKITRCHFYDLGGGALCFGIRECDGSEVSDCLVHHTGRYHASAVGLSAWRMDVRHCEVHHTSYIGIQCNGDGVTVEKNYVHDVMQVLNDGAAIYSIKSRGGTFRRNLVCGVHPIKGHHLRIAYYLDQDSDGWLLEENVAVDCGFPLHKHMGGNHLVRNNIFTSERDMLIDQLGGKWHCHYMDNLFSAVGKIIFRTAEGYIETFEDNCYHSVDGSIVHSVLDSANKIIGEKNLEVNESNAYIDEVRFSAEDRVFTVGEKMIDLRDIGVREGPHTISY